MFPYPCYDGSCDHVVGLRKATYLYPRVLLLDDKRREPFAHPESRATYRCAVIQPSLSLSTEAPPHRPSATPRAFPNATLRGAATRPRRPPL